MGWIMGAQIDAAEREKHGTLQDTKACGDAEAAAREGGDEAAGAQAGAEVRAVPPATFKTSPHEVPSPKPVALSLSTRYVTYCNT